MTTPETKEINIFETHVIPPEDDDDNVSLQPEDWSKTLLKKTRKKTPQAEMHQMHQTQDFEVPESPIHLFLMTTSPSPWSPKMSYCGGITDLETYLLQG